MGTPLGRESTLGSRGWPWCCWLRPWQRLSPWRCTTAMRGFTAARLRCLRTVRPPGRSLSSWRSLRCLRAVRLPGRSLSSWRSLPPGGRRLSCRRSLAPRPHATYELVGNDCASNGPDRIWATGVTDSRGSAQLIGQPWTVSTSDAYFLVLDSRFLNQRRLGPAVHGFFGKGPPGLSPVSDGVAPCAALTSLGSA